MDVKEYTKHSLLKDMVLTEKHLTDYIKSDGNNAKMSKDFCIECLTKHALNIEGLGEEGVQFFDGDSYYKEVCSFGDELYRSTPKMTKDLAISLREKLRSLRKSLIAEHLILDDIDDNDTFDHSIEGPLGG